jgi:hypothetical protein
MDMDDVDVAFANQAPESEGPSQVVLDSRAQAMHGRTGPGRFRNKRILPGKEVGNLVLERGSVAERDLIDDETLSAPATQSLDEVEDSQRLGHPPLFEHHRRSRGRAAYNGYERCR